MRTEAVGVVLLDEDVAKGREGVLFGGGRFGEGGVGVGHGWWVGRWVGSLGDG